MNEIETNQMKAGRNVIIGTIIVGAFISSLGQTVMTASLPSIMRQFGIDAGIGQWLTTAYLLFLGIMIPCTGYLMNRFSVKKLYLFSIFMFLVGCVFAILSWNFYVLLFARIIQALGAGILLPLPQVVTFRLYEPDKRGVIMGVVGLTTGFGPAFGPTFAGWIVDHYGWHTIFYIMAALSLLCIIMALLKLKEEKMDTSEKLDILSVVLSTIGFSGLLTGVTNQGNYGLSSPLTIVPFLAGAVCLALFVARQLRISNPLLELRVFQYRDFTFSTILLIFIYGSILTVSTLVPLYIQSVRGFTATASGLVVLPGSLLLAFLNPVTGKILDKKGPFLLSVGGLLILGVGTFGMASMNDTTSALFVGGANAVQMLGIVALLQPLMTWAVNVVPEKYVSHSTAIMNTARQVGGAILSAVFVTIMSNVSRSSNELKGIQTAFFVIAVVVIVSIVGVLIFMRPKKTQTQPEAAAAPKTSPSEGIAPSESFVITIAREYGSGGREIGEKVANALGVKLYDKELIDMVATESGFSPAFVTAHSESASMNSRLYEFAIKNYETYASGPYERKDLSDNELLFGIQSGIIKELASKGSCVIVGRCADYVLKDLDRCLSVFIRSEESHKLKRIVEEYGISEQDCAQESKKKDGERAWYYKNYTGQDWGDPKHYHLVLDSGRLGIQRAVNLILEAADFADHENQVQSNI